MTLTTFCRARAKSDFHWYVPRHKSFRPETWTTFREMLNILQRWVCQPDLLTAAERRPYRSYLKSAQQHWNNFDFSRHEPVPWNFPVQVYVTALMEEKGKGLISDKQRPEPTRKLYRELREAILGGMTYQRIQRKFDREAISAYSANARNQISPLRYFGLARAGEHGEGGSITISDVGEQFLDENVPPEAVIEGQLLRLQIYNPFLPARYRSGQILPFVFLLQLMTQHDLVQVNLDEYILFVTCNHSMKDVQQTAKRIESYRNLSESQQQRLLALLHKQPSGRGARPLYEELEEGADRELDLWASVAVLDRLGQDEGHGIRLADESRAKRLLSRLGKNPVYIDFANESDWFDYYGDPSRLPNLSEAIRYYTRARKLEQAEAAAKEAERAGEVTIARSARRDIERVQREKVVEDYYRDHLDEIEKGLTLYRKGGQIGQQFETDIGIIDLLCRDRFGNFVVIEFKWGESSDETIGQILRYIGWVRANLAGGRQVRGIIMCAAIDEKLKWAIEGMQNPDVKKWLKIKRHGFHVEDIEV